MVALYHNRCFRFFSDASDLVAIDRPENLPLLMCRLGRFMARESLSAGSRCYCSVPPVFLQLIGFALIE